MTALSPDIQPTRAARGVSLDLRWTDDDHVLPFDRASNPYRVGAVELTLSDFRAVASQGLNLLTLSLG